MEAEIDAKNNIKLDSIVRISAIGDILLGNNLKNNGKNNEGLYTNILKTYQDI